MAIIPREEYADFHENYIKLLPDGEPLDLLKAQTNRFFELYYRIPADKEDYRYEAGKWSVKEIISHLADTERIMSYRALRFSRNDTTALPGFDQDLYVSEFPSAQVSLAELLSEFRAIRLSTFTLFSNMSAEMLLRKGQASGNQVSVRALLGIIAGHERHHAGILVERYGLVMPELD
jgi:uncharacterized damage-inducible protein DinB